MGSTVLGVDTGKGIDGGMVVGLVNASILAADMADLSGEVSRVLKAGADWIHVDVVDNHFAKVRTASRCLSAPTSCRKGMAAIKGTALC